MGESCREKRIFERENKGKWVECSKGREKIYKIRLLLYKISNIIKNVAESVCAMHKWL